MQDRFWSKVKKTEGCWIWSASLDRHGYGQYRFHGRTQRSHRVAYELTIGNLPSGLVLDHLCRNRSCVNPDHLEPVTLSENMSRQVAKNSKKRICPRGHGYDKLDSYGRRRCSVCDKANHRAAYLRRKVLAC